MTSSKGRDSVSGPLDIAVIGTGLIGRKHINLIAANPKFRLAATVNPSGSSSNLLELAGIPNYKTCQAMLAAESIAAAVIASPNETHAEVAIELIEAGIPVLIEKPITGDIEEGTRIIASAERNDVPVLMGHHRRYNPIIAEMRELICSGRMGPLVGFSGVWSVFKPDPYYEAAWRTGPSGGPIMINLIHEIDYLHAMCGRIVSVGAMSSAKRRTHSGEETLGVLLQFEQGTVGSIVLSDSAASPWSWEQATGENDPAFPMNRQSPYRFLFERGGIEFPSLKIWQQSVPNWNSGFDIEELDRLQDPMRNVFSDQIDHFYEVAAGASEPMVTARDGLNALNVALTVKRAIVEGRGFYDVPELPV